MILTSSRLPDNAIRTLAKSTPLVVLNRHVDQVPSVVSDNVRAVKRAVEHLASDGHRSLTYLAGPEASWADGMRWRGLLEAGHELGLKVQRIGPCRPTLNGGRHAVESWRQAPTTGVVAYNDLDGDRVPPGGERCRVRGAGRRQRGRVRQHPGG